MKANQLLIIVLTIIIIIIVKQLISLKRELSILKRKNRKIKIEKLTSKKIFKKNEFQELSYEKEINLKNGGVILVDNFNKYQHRVSYSINEELKELRAGWFKTINIFVEQRTVEPMKMLCDYNCKLNYDNVEYVELVMENEFSNINKHQLDNMPRRIIFLDKNKISLLELYFNRYGFMVKAIDEFKNIVFEETEKDVCDLFKQEII